MKQKKILLKYDAIKFFFVKKGNPSPKEDTLDLGLFYIQELETTQFFSFFHNDVFDDALPIMIIFFLFVQFVKPPGLC